MMYWLIRRTMRGLSVLFKQQCSGKQQVGSYGSLEWCQQRAFHDGVCTNYNEAAFGEEDV